MKYMLIAGEASGDLPASQLIRALREADRDARFVFLGGDLMASAAGCEPVIHYRDMAYMGFSEVLRHLPSVFSNLRTAKSVVTSHKPDALILVDYPSFNLKVAKTADSAGIPVYYFISPKLWAWKQWRVKSIKAMVRKVLCILPFEPAWYGQHDYDRALYVGNPSVAEMRTAIDAAPPRSEFLKETRLRDHRIIALLPGSRAGEIRCNLPVMDAVARQFPQYTIAVAGAPGIDDGFYKGLTKFQVVRGRTHDLLAHSHAAIVTSGTATLEAALANVPQVVMYRSNGSKIAYNLMKSLLHVEYVSLPNLINAAPTVPEMLLHFCTPDAVAAELRRLTPDQSNDRIAMLDGYAAMRRALGDSDAAANSARIIIDDLKNEKK